MIIMRDEDHDSVYHDGKDKDRDENDKDHDYGIRRHKCVAALVVACKNYKCPIWWDLMGVNLVLEELYQQQGWGAVCTITLFNSNINTFFHTHFGNIYSWGS